MWQMESGLSWTPVRTQGSVVSHEVMHNAVLVLPVSHLFSEKASQVHQEVECKTRQVQKKTKKKDKCTR